jgi:hypothetical protein
MIAIMETNACAQRLATEILKFSLIALAADTGIRPDHNLCHQARTQARAGLYNEPVR